MNIINFFVNLIKDPRTAIASWIAMGVAPTLGFIFLIVFIETGVVFFPFLPFSSGISGMRWSRFTPFSVLGGLCWSTLFTLLGYFFGGIPAVQKHFELVIIAILVLSLIPTIVGLLKAKFGKKKPAAEDTAETADAE